MFAALANYVNHASVLALRVVLLPNVLWGVILIALHRLILLLLDYKWHAGTLEQNFTSPFMVIIADDVFTMVIFPFRIFYEDCAARFRVGARNIFQNFRYQIIGMVFLRGAMQWVGCLKKQVFIVFQLCKLWWNWIIVQFELFIAFIHVDTIVTLKLWT